MTESDEVLKGVAGAVLRNGFRITGILKLQSRVKMLKDGRWAESDRYQERAEGCLLGKDNGSELRKRKYPTRIE